MENKTNVDDWREFTTLTLNVIIDALKRKVEYNKNEYLKHGLRLEEGERKKHLGRMEAYGECISMVNKILPDNVFPYVPCEPDLRNYTPKGQ